MRTNIARAARDQNVCHQKLYPTDTTANGNQLNIRQRSIAASVLARKPK
jgi:hypothetical protein